jgi:hypothetical protein
MEEKIATRRPLKAAVAVLQLFKPLNSKGNQSQMRFHAITFITTTTQE